MPEEHSEKKLSSHKPKRNIPAIKKMIVGIVVCLACVGVGIGGVLTYEQLTSGSEQVTAEHKVLANDGNAVATTEETTIGAVVTKSSPTVVSVLTTVTANSYFYGTRTQEGAGSGIIVSSDGTILTNKHVIDNATTVSVVLADGTTYDKVEVVATDPMNDIAFLKIPDASGLPVAELGDSTTIRVGQQVIAIGNSLGQYQNTVTSGIISGTGRPISAQAGSSVETLTDLLQTDAAINPGNSGGPLLNTSGQVIGINTAIAADAEGIGFAIPINAVKGMLSQVLAGSTTPKHAYLGVRYVPVNAAVAKQHNLSVATGAYVYADTGEEAVVSGSPADTAGLKSGDVVMKVNGIEVGARGGVSSLIAEYSPGDTIELTIVRGTETKTLSVTLAAYSS